MAGSSICRVTGKKKKDCVCFMCSNRRDNAKQRGGANRGQRKGTNRKEHDTKGKNQHGRRY